MTRLRALSKVHSLPPVDYTNLAGERPHVLIREYAVHSWLYYDQDTSLICDGDFDKLCKYILDNFAAIKPHDINGYLTEDDMRAGTGMTVASKVCGMTLRDARKRFESR